MIYSKQSSFLSKSPNISGHNTQNNNTFGNGIGSGCLPSSYSPQLMRGSVSTYQQQRVTTNNESQSQNKYVDLQIKKEHRSVILRDKKQLQLIEQQNSEIQETVHMLYHKKKLNFILSNQESFQFLLNIALIPFIFDTLFNNLTVTQISCMSLYLILVVIQTWYILPAASYLVCVIYQDQKRDKFNLLKGLPIQDKRSSIQQDDETTIYQGITQKERQSINQCELSDKVNELPQAQLLKGHALQLLQLKSLTSRNLTQGPNRHPSTLGGANFGGVVNHSLNANHVGSAFIPHFPNKGGRINNYTSNNSIRKFQIQKIPEYSESSNPKVKESNSSLLLPPRLILTDFYKYFDIFNVLEVNGLIQIALCLLTFKHGLLNLAFYDYKSKGLTTSQQLSSVLLILPFIYLIKTLCFKLLQCKQSQTFVHLLYLCIFSDFSQRYQTIYQQTQWQILQNWSFKFFTFILIVSLSILNLKDIKSKEEKHISRFEKKIEIEFRAERYERIVENVRNGFCVLNQSSIHFFNVQFGSILCAKSYSQALNLLRQIQRKVRVPLNQSNSGPQNHGNYQMPQQNQEKLQTELRSISVMDDILNFLKNRPSAEVGEDIEFYLERIDHRTNQKYVRFFSISFQPVRWDGQKNILLSIKEITQDKKVLEQRLVNQLRNMMFKSFTHEIKTPLNGVIQSLELTQSILQNVNRNQFSITPNSTQLPIQNYKQSRAELFHLEKLLKQIKSGVFILQNNLNDLIDYQQIESGSLKINFKQFNLKACFDHILSIIKPQLSNKNVRFIPYFDYSLPELMENDQERLIRIIINILLNAQKYTSRGHIKFRVQSIGNKKESKQQSQDFQSTTQNQNVYIKFEISDTGLGIPEEKLPFIFNLFEADLMGFNYIQAQGNQKSAKVGLPICQALCKEMGGIIKVKAARDQGSKFWFILPCFPNKKKTLDQNPINQSQTFNEFGLKNSKVTNGISSSQQNCENSEGAESIESKDLELEDLYESDHDHLGIPIAFGMTSHMMNENILLSFFPNQAQNNSDVIDHEEEMKNGESSDTFLDIINNKNGILSQNQKKMLKKLARTGIASYTPARIMRSNSQNNLQEVQEESKEMTFKGENIYDNSNGLMSGFPGLGSILRKEPSQENNVLIQQNQHQRQMSPHYHKMFQGAPNNDKSVDSNGDQNDRKPIADRNLNLISTSQNPPLIMNNLVKNSPQYSNNLLKNYPDFTFVRSDKTNSNFALLKKQKNDDILVYAGTTENLNDEEILQKRKNTGSIIRNNNSFIQGLQQEQFSQLSVVCSCPQILIVDDIDMNRQILKTIIHSKFGIRSDEAYNGKESLQMIKEKAFNECCSSYKIIIMDFEMPVMNGIMATKKIRQYQQEGRIESQLFIVAYTAYVDEESGCKDAGMDFFLPKPASMAAIQQVLKEINDRLQKAEDEQQLQLMQHAGGYSSEEPYTGQTVVQQTMDNNVMTIFEETDHNIIDLHSGPPNRAHILQVMAEAGTNQHIVTFFPDQAD